MANRDKDSFLGEGNAHGDNVTTLMADGELRTTSLMQPGLHRMNADGPETVEIIRGRCRVKLPDTQEWNEYGAGEKFHVPAASQYEIEVTEELDYVCRTPHISGE